MVEKGEGGRSAMEELQETLEVLWAGPFQKSRIEASLAIELHETPDSKRHKPFRFYGSKDDHPLFSANELRVPGSRAMTPDHLLIVSILPELHIRLREVRACYGRGTFGINPDCGPPCYTYALSDGTRSFTFSRPPEDRLECVTLRKAGMLSRTEGLRSRLSRWWKR